MELLVGNWVVDSSLNHVCHNTGNQVIKLEPQTIRVLAYLMQKPNQVVSREELITHVWEGRVVGDHSVYRAINRLRKALDEGDSEPYIKTLPKKGYMLIKPVFENSQKEASIEIETEAKILKPQLELSREYLILFSFVIINIVALWYVVLFDKQNDKNQLDPITLTVTEHSNGYVELNKEPINSREKTLNADSAFVFTQKNLVKLDNHAKYTK